MAVRFGLAVLLSITWISRGSAQAPVRCDGSLSEARIVQLIQGDVAEARIRQYIETCGVGFVMDREAEGRLKSAGATAGILALLRAKAAPPPSPQVDADTVFWNSIRETDDRSLFQEYLQKFPKGLFRSLAERKLRELRDAELRSELPGVLGKRDWKKAEALLRELTTIMPGDEQTQRWQKEIAEGMAADRAAAEKAEAERQAKEREVLALREAIKLFSNDFADIPPGSFTMGCSPDDNKCEKDEKPPHRVQITRPFQMQKHEVTQALWQAVMNNNPSHFKGPLFPVEQVSWNDTREFLNRLNARSDGWVYRLPTEAEWEYAARAGSTGKYTEKSLDEIAWYSNNSGNQTHLVGEKKENAWGLHDMLGNVWEWCEDWYGERYYKDSPGTDPQGPFSGNYRVVRGGSWSYESSYSRVSFRNRFLPDVRYYNSGFRVAREQK